MSRRSAAVKCTSSPLASAARKGISGFGVDRHASRDTVETRSPRTAAISAPVSSTPLRERSNDMTSRKPAHRPSAATVAES